MFPRRNSHSRSSCAISFLTPDGGARDLTPICSMYEFIGHDADSLRESCDSPGRLCGSQEKGIAERKIIFVQIDAEVKRPKSDAEVICMAAGEVNSRRSLA